MKELEMILDASPDLLEHVNKFGHIPEELFDKYEFAIDKSSDGEEFIRNNSIRCEHMHRAKMLTHPHQVYLRQKDIDDEKMIAKAKRDKANANHQKHLDKHAAIVKQLCDIALSHSYVCVPMLLPVDLCPRRNNDLCQQKTKLEVDK